MQVESSKGGDVSQLTYECQLDGAKAVACIIPHAFSIRTLKGMS